MLSRTAFALAVIAVLLISCSTSQVSHDPSLPPLQLPTIPPEYASDTVVVPPALQAKFDALVAGTSGIDWDTVDVRTLELNWRRARVYEMYARPRASNVGFRVITFSDPRSEADAIIDRIALTLQFSEESYYDASEQRGHYSLRPTSRTPINLSTIGQAAWIADWVLQQFPDKIELVLPFLQPSHSGGYGNDF